MLVLASSFGDTFGLLATFLGIGLVANVLIVYIAVQILAERAENREHLRHRE